MRSLTRIRALTLARFVTDELSLPRVAEQEVAQQREAIAALVRRTAVLRTEITTTQQDYRLLLDEQRRGQHERKDIFVSLGDMKSAVQKLTTEQDRLVAEVGELQLRLTKCETSIAQLTEQFEERKQKSSSSGTESAPAASSGEVPAPSPSLGSTISNDLLLRRIQKLEAVMSAQDIFISAASHIVRRSHPGATPAAVLQAATELRNDPSFSSVLKVCEESAFAVEREPTGDLVLRANQVYITHLSGRQEVKEARAAISTAGPITTCVAAMLPDGNGGTIRALKVTYATAAGAAKALTLKFPGRRWTVESRISADIAAALHRLSSPSSIAQTGDAAPDTKLPVREMRPMKSHIMTPAPVSTPPVLNSEDALETLLSDDDGDKDDLARNVHDS